VKKAFGSGDEDFISRLFDQVASALPGGIDELAVHGVHSLMFNWGPRTVPKGYAYVLGMNVSLGPETLTALRSMAVIFWTRLR